MSNDAAASSNLAARWARRVLRPIISILIRAGLPAGEFAAIARSLYVDVASKEFGIRGRRTNTSRIAMLTGLSRTQAKRELDRQEAEQEDETEPLDNVRHASRVLLGWHTDARFIEPDGQPRPLSVDDEDDFPLLYEAYSGKAVPATSMLKELITVGAVEKLSDGRIMARARSYTPGQTDPKSLFRIGLAISDLATTAHHNLYFEKKKRSRFERFATNQLVDKRHVEAFQDFLEIEGQAFLERADNWLTQRETDKTTDTVVRVGVGVYQVLTDPVVPPK
ncbi:MAG: DUF6502 family protein [Gammaproteobacteria bacterium]